MKIKYIFEQEEITTCVTCPFRCIISDEGTQWCTYLSPETVIDITSCYEGTKPENCPLKKLE